MKSDVVIIGAGHSGGMAAVLLRQNKFPGKITIIGNEEFYPYQRPPLSKGFLSKKIKENSLYLKTQDYYSKNDIDCILGTTVSKIIKDKKYLILDNRKKIYYQKLIISTGSLLKKIEVTTENKDLCYLRNISDSRKLSSLINTKDSIAIIGSGYIGLEIAAVAAEKGLEVNIIEITDHVMSRLKSREISEILLKKHQDHGVNFYLKNCVLDITRKNGKKIIITDKNRLEVDIVAVGIGINPNDILARDAGIKCTDGIIVDENCLTSSEDIFAIGDCTNHFDYTYDRFLRLESVHNAIEQAKAVARYISGNEQKSLQAPWFWTEQYNLKIQIVGLANNHDASIIRGSIERESFTIFYFKERKLIASYFINTKKDFITARKLIEKRIDVPVNEFSKEDFNLKSLI